MISAVFKAFAQLTDPRIARVLFLSLGMTIGLYVALVAALWWGLGALSLFDIPWLDTTIDFFSGFGAFFLALLLFPAIVTACTGFFLDEVAAAVEARHYPGLPAPRRQGLGEAIWVGLRFGLVAVGLNLLVLPLYIFIPGINLVLFFGLNGYLISREYFETVALRRIDPHTATALRKVYMVRLWVLGALITLLFMVPFLNILGPVLGIAAMVHVAHRLTGSALARGELR